MNRRIISVGAAALVLPAALAGCVANDDGASSGTDAAGSGDPIAVEIDDTTCDVAVSEANSGQVKFTLNNKGPAKNEFEVLAEDKLRIVGELENLGPGTTRDFTVLLEPGTYYTACKKNMVGSLVDAREFTVTGDAVELAADDQAAIDEGVKQYEAYIRDQSGQLLEATKNFAEAYKAGDDDAARAQYAPARMFYERIEPTAEAFGDIDPALDEREADYQEADDTADREWTGWHVIEKDLWQPKPEDNDGKAYQPFSQADREKYADKLVADTQELYDLVYADDFEVNIDDISNGAISLLEEVATTKITGEEEHFSHTDLWDFQANLEGAEVAFGNVEALAKKKDPELTEQINQRIGDLKDELAKYKEGDGYVYYDTLNDQQTRELADKVDALRVPLAKLTEAILS
ncbi:PbrT family lead (Pb2+) uptake porter [Corynebacterium frankenforstense DSM 45800]|uniref:PbrT family lead (Pb2+) uptake porter n=1 Tax=Corynebacterium frankenforstense DSM 45800 TaxID=1437875 RepID=A0A1L7CR57_9CORY|nr:iron uptake system protein EfeO [Corynebacterium frankenforstense]APT88308.1 PbrT family lead (Pb2+) uptake porter [Corynebacterium frankenforstense DSM 45800]